jgi:hypothetical protein
VTPASNSASSRGVRARGRSNGRARLLIAASLCLTLVACKTDADRARAAAQAWLPAIDGGDYAQGWTAGAPYLQRATMQAQWVVSMNRMRQPLGKLLSRTMKSTKATTCALSDPCVVIETDVSFEHSQAATETITVMPAAGGQWKVAGYFIK